MRCYMIAISCSVNDDACDIPTVRTRDIKAAKMLAAAPSRGEATCGSFNSSLCICLGRHLEYQFYRIYIGNAGR